MNAPTTLEAALWRQKLAPPHAAVRMVERPVVADLAQRSESAGVVLVCAPAGFGKTTVMRGLHDALRAAGTHVAWVTLDPADNDAQRFLAYLDAALETAGPDHTAAAGRRSPDAVLARLMTQGVVLFLDDFDAVTSDDVLGIVRTLVRGLPPGSALVLGGRRMPDLELGRLRAQGRVLEAGMDELRFSPAESGALLTGILGRSLSPDMAERLHQRTEGWAAALQLAGLALHKRLDPEAFVGGFSGTSSGLASFLAEEILATQPPAVRDLLLQASILDTMCPELCDELSGRTGNAELLMAIERDNLFVYRLDEPGPWWRFHRLFAEFLREELMRERAAEVPELHRRAAGWFARNGKASSAVRHATLSGDPELAASLADNYVQPFTLAGRLTTVVRWLEPLPADVLDRHPRLQVYFAASLTGAFQHRRAEPLIERLVGAPDVLAELDPASRGVLLFTISFGLLLQDRFEESLSSCEEHLEQLDPQDAQARAGIMNVRNVCRMHLHRYADVEETEADIRSLAAGVTAYGLVSAEYIAGMAELAQGRLNSATATFDAALATALAESSPTGAPTAMVAAGVAEALYERGDVAGLADLLGRHLATITLLGIPDAVIQAHVQHIRALHRSAGYAEACHAVNDLKRLGYERDLPRLVATAWAEHSRLAVLEDDLVSAERYLQMAETAGPYTTLWDESGVTLRARLLVAQARADEAVDLLRPELGRLSRTPRRRHVMKLRTVNAVALWAAGRRRDALEQLDTALRDAGPEPFLHVFADEGPRLGDLLRELLARQQSEHAERARLVLEAIGAGDAAPASGEPAIEPLSHRELEILALVAGGLSNQAIAEQLYLSLPTVKSHVRNVLRKLGAKNRTEAVATARRHQLLAG